MEIIILEQVHEEKRSNGSCCGDVKLQTTKILLFHFYSSLQKQLLLYLNISKNRNRAQKKEDLLYILVLLSSLFFIQVKNY